MIPPNEEDSLPKNRLGANPFNQFRPPLKMREIKMQKSGQRLAARFGILTIRDLMIRDLMIRDLTIRNLVKLRS
jgi:hypothetical protein